MRLEVIDVSVRLGLREVLRGASLSAESGQLVGLMGPSGSGKSTLLGIVAGDVSPDSGLVSMDDDRRHIAWIFQSTPLLTRRTALDNVALGPLSAGVIPATAHVEAMRSMRDLGVGHLASQPVYQLSGGERQRLTVARAIAAGSALILADEPTASLDPASRDAVVEALHIAARNGAAVLIATHDQAVAAACDRVYRLDDGIALVAGEHDDAHV